MYLPGWLREVEVQKPERGFGPEGEDATVVRSEDQRSRAKVAGRHEGAERVHRVVASVEGAVARDHRQVESRQNDEQVVVEDVNGARVLTEVEGGQSEERSEQVEVADVVAHHHLEVERPRVVLLMKDDLFEILGIRQHRSDETDLALNKNNRFVMFYKITL